jgi:hypothetical protein
MYFEAIQNNLEDAISYNSVYEIEQAAGLVKKRDKCRIVMLKRHTNTESVLH